MKDELTDFLRFCAVERRLAPLTWSQARATAALKSFFRFLVDDEQLERDPARPLRTPKKREALPDVLTMAELERLLAAPARGDIWERHFHGKAERDRLLLALFAYAGLRRSELLGLSWDASTSRAGSCAQSQGRPLAGRPDPSGARAARRRLLRNPRAANRAVALRRRPGQAAQLHPTRPGLPPLAAAVGRLAASDNRPVAGTLDPEGAHLAALRRLADFDGRRFWRWAAAKAG